MVDLSIVIVSYNVKEYLARCLQSIYDPPPDVSHEVIVVDNASTDGSVGAVRDSFPKAVVIANKENRGFARGNNQGIGVSTGRYVLLLNPDTEVGKGTLAGLVTLADSHPEASAFTCRLLNSDGTLQHSCFRFPNLRMAAFGFFTLVPQDSVLNGRYPPDHFDTVFEPEHILGACLMVRREILQELGGLDEKFHIYFEETDLCYRLVRSGHRALYCPAYSVIHHGQRSTSALRETMSVEFYRSQAYFYRRNYHLARLLALKAIVLAGVSSWAARSCLSFLRGRIDGNLLKARLRSYLQILTA